MNTREMSDLVYSILSTIVDFGEEATECVLNTPTTMSKFPCRVISTPLESTSSSYNAIPVVKNFQVSIEHWANNQRDSMDMSYKTDEKMAEKNFIRTNTSNVWFDETTKKYIIRTTYENRWYSINDSFEVIR